MGRKGVSPAGLILWRVNSETIQHPHPQDSPKSHIHRTPHVHCITYTPPKTLAYMCHTPPPPHQHRGPGLQVTLGPLPSPGRIDGGAGMPVPVTGLLFVNAHPSALSGVSSPAVGGPASCNQTCSTFWPLERRKQARDSHQPPVHGPQCWEVAPDREPGQRPEGHPKPG